MTRQLSLQNFCHFLVCLNLLVQRLQSIHSSLALLFS